MKVALALAALGLISGSAASAAKPLPATPIQESRLASGKQQFDPSKGYVFMHGRDRMVLTLIKLPTDEELSAYRAEWQEEFDEAMRRYTRKAATWEEDVEFRRRNGREPPPRPVEPDRQTFAIDSLEGRMIVGFGFNREFTKGEDYRSYLTELEPGTYIYYASSDPGHGAWATGMCMCMGTVMFEVAAGRITNIGNFPSMRWVGPEQARAAQVGWVPDAAPQPVDYTLPASLAQFPSVKADWRAFGKINNMRGVVVARMPPIPGVLAYDRDRIVDLRTGSERGTAAR